MHVDTRPTLRPLSEYCSRLPSRVRGRSLNRATLWRWALRGRRDGRILRSVVIGAGRFTCDAWVVEFMDPVDPLPTPRPNRQGMDPAERERIAQRLGVPIRAHGPAIGPSGA